MHQLWNVFAVWIAVEEGEGNSGLVKNTKPLPMQKCRSKSVSPDLGTEQPGTPKNRSAKTFQEVSTGDKDHTVC